MWGKNTTSVRRVHTGLGQLERRWRAVQTPPEASPSQARRSPVVGCARDRADDAGKFLSG
jgi:hypothetical protein